MREVMYVCIEEMTRGYGQVHVVYRVVCADGILLITDM